MKERFLAGLKKASVIIIASIMLLGVIPLGMLSHMTTVNAEGEFLRLAPETEVSIAAENAVQNDSVPELDKGAYLIGEKNYRYLRFDLRDILDRDAEKISGAKLRITILQTPVLESVPVQLWLMPEDDWSRSMNWKKKPSRLGETLVASKTVSSETDGKSMLFEVDLTEYMKKWMEEGREKVSFRLDSLGKGVSAVCAGTAHEDPLFRPCLKVLTGTATDQDSQNLKKAWLSNRYATGQEQTTMVTVGEGKEVYLKFSLNTKNIQGSVYQAMLQLTHLQGDLDAMLRIDRLTKTDWSEEELEQGAMVKGERYPVYREENFEAKAYHQINLTDVVNDALAGGESEVALLLWCENGKMMFDNAGEMAPRLRVSVSDNRDVVAMMEASAGVLGKNNKADAITKDMADDGIANNGIRTEINWKAMDVKSGAPAGEVLSVNGKIYRPKWFKESREILATATISAGEYQRERYCYLTVLPQNAPNFDDVEFSTMLDIGATDEEIKKGFESVGTILRGRWVEGRKMTYREMEQGDMMILNFPVDAKKKNYLTIKLWEEDAFPGVEVSSLQNRELKPFVIQGTDMAEKETGGFLYLTYPIPLTYTQGRDYVSLRLTVPEGEEMQEEKRMASLYGAYITQTSYFDPMSFAEQGEVVVKKNQEESTLYQFLRKIYGAAEKSFDFRDTKNQEEPLPETEESGVYADVENQDKAVLVFGGEEQLMLELPDTGTATKIYRDTPYYNAYSEMKVKEYHDGKLQVVDYGIYRFFRNRGRQELGIPWKEESMSGLYKELAGDNCYSFLKKGEMVDDSVLAEGTTVADGSKLTVLPGEVMAVVLMAEPLYYPDFRVSEINGQAVSELKLKEELSITSLTLRAMGTAPKAEEKVAILCGVYDRGMLVGLEQKQLTVSRGQVAAEILLEAPLLVKPGQTLKVYADEGKIQGEPLAPILELPQKQQVNEKKPS